MLKSEIYVFDLFEINRHGFWKLSVETAFLRHHHQNLRTRNFYFVEEARTLSFNGHKKQETSSGRVKRAKPKIYNLPHAKTFLEIKLSR